MGRPSGELLIRCLIAVTVLEISPEATQAASRASTVALLVPEHKMYQAAAEQCSAALRAKGLNPIIFSFKREMAAPTTAPAESNPSGTPVPLASADQELFVQISATQPALIIAFGEHATLACLKHTRNIPIVHSMIPNLLDSPVATNPEYHKRTTGVTPDLRPADQLNWIRQVQHDVRRLAVLHSPQNSRTADAIREAGKQAGIDIGLIETSTEQFAQAVDTLTADKYDAVLMIADAQVYNTVSVKRLLLWGIRQKKGVWSFSDNFVKAGALGCLYSPPESIGSQTAAVAMEVLAGKDPSSLGVIHPQSIERALNQRTAKMIGLAPPKSVLNGVTLLGDE